jgi:predicted HicB family RNase H-like nuclease
VAKNNGKSVNTWMDETLVMAAEKQATNVISID